MEVLHWPYAEISTEAATEGGFADYVCRVQGRARLVVEAKRDGRSLGVEGRPSGAAFKLSGGVFKADSAKEGIGQAIRYSGAKNAELACVTNGREWIIFRGTRLGDGLDTRDGMAFVFSHLVDIEQKFNLFYSLLSYESAKSFSYRPYFQEAEGQPIRTSVFHKSLRAAGSARFLPSGDLGGDIDKMMSSFFQRLTGDEDPDMIGLCFVETPESHHADSRLAKIAEDIVDRISALDTGRGTALTNLIQRVQQSKRHEFVLIVGTKGAGKSTFISRFFDIVLPRAVAEKCTVVRIDLKNSTGDSASLVNWLDESLLREAENSLFPEGPEFAEIEGMFFDEYQRRRKGSWAALYRSDKDQFQTRFGDLIEDFRMNRPHEYIQGLIRHVVNNRKALPVIVFDNADHFDIDYQQRVYQYARSIYEKSLCLVILPITDRTNIEISEILGYFSGMNIEDRAVLGWLDVLLKTGLLLNYDPTVLDIREASMVEISPAGRQHLFWALGNNEYFSAMAQVTPLLSESTFTEMRDNSQDRKWRERAVIFIEYLLREDAMYCSIPAHEAYQSQQRIRLTLDSVVDRLKASPSQQGTGSRETRKAPETD